MPNAFLFFEFLPSSSDVLIYEDYQDESEDLVVMQILYFVSISTNLNVFGKLGRIS